MTERLLFLTGHLAYPRLDRLMRAMGETSFSWEVCDIGVKVAALMTEAIIMRRLARPVSADRIILPGRCRADLAHLTHHFDVPVARGPAKRFVALCNSNFRRDRGCFGASGRGASRLRGGSEQVRRRCDRHWLS